MVMRRARYTLCPHPSIHPSTSLSSAARLHACAAPAITVRVSRIVRSLFSPAAAGRQLTGDHRSGALPIFLLLYTYYYSTIAKGKNAARKCYWHGHGRTGVPLTHAPFFCVRCPCWLAGSHSYSDSHGTPALSVLVSLS